MELLIPEIEIEPGRSAQQPARSGQVGANCTVLRIANSSPRVNAYVLRIRCTSGFWNDDWYDVQAMDVPLGGHTGAPVQQPAGMPDRWGKDPGGGKWLRIHLSPGASRDVLVTFFVERSPAARAGRYNLDIEVKTEVQDPQTSGFVESPNVELKHAVACIRPFHSWQVDIEPHAGRRVGRFRRHTQFEVDIVNSGNDWLYCELLTPPAEDGGEIYLDSYSTRVAVRPPEPGEKAVHRLVPVTATTRMKRMLGEQDRKTLPIKVARVDAPSVAALAVPPPILYPQLKTLNLGRAVVECPAPATEPARDAPQNRPLIYCPPIPTNLTQVGTFLKQNFQYILMVAILLPLFYAVMISVFRNISVDYLTSQLPAHERHLPVKGRFLEGGSATIQRVKLEGDKETLGPDDSAPIKIDKNLGFYVELPEIKEDFAKFHVKAFHRASFVPFLSNTFLLTVQAHGDAMVEVGKKAVTVKPPPDRTARATAECRPRGKFKIISMTGPPFTGQPSVKVNGETAQATRVAGDVIEAIMPADIKGGTYQLPVSCLDGDRGRITIMNTVSVVDELTDASAPGGGGAPAGGGAGKPASGVAGGGGKPGGGATTAVAGTGARGGPTPPRQPSPQGGGDVAPTADQALRRIGTAAAAAAGQNRALDQIPGYGAACRMLDDIMRNPPSGHAGAVAWTAQGIRFGMEARAGKQRDWEECFKKANDLDHNYADAVFWWYEVDNLFGDASLTPSWLRSSLLAVHIPASRVDNLVSTLKAQYNLK